MPAQIAPYHLRLDWLMWFAAMGNYYQHPWFVHFVEKLLEGDAATLSLLRSNPFPGAPPKYVRATLYQYDFAHSPMSIVRRGTGGGGNRRVRGFRLCLWTIPISSACWCRRAGATGERREAGVMSSGRVRTA